MFPTSGSKVKRWFSDVWVPKLWVCPKKIGCLAYKQPFLPQNMHVWPFLGKYSPWRPLLFSVGSLAVGFGAEAALTIERLPPFHRGILQHKDQSSVKLYWQGIIVRQLSSCQGWALFFKVQLVQKILIVSVTLWSFSRIVHKATSLL